MADIEAGDFGEGVCPFYDALMHGWGTEDFIAWKEQLEAQCLADR